MVHSFIRLCTAALAGSLIGIAYERLPPITDWQVGPKTVDALSSSITPRSNNHNVHRGDTENRHRGLPDIDAKVSAENLKHSAKYGLPSKDNLRLFNDYILSYDRRLRAPAWVLEHLTAEKLEDKSLTDRNRSNFVEDLAIHEYFRAKNADFTNSGYDRGHMAAAGNHKNSQDDLDQTFAYSNISPQKPQFNRGGWEKLERYVRYMAKRSRNLYVVTGPLYLPLKARDGNLYVTYRVLGNDHVSVPTHYFKVILYETKQDRLVMEAFLMPNEDNLNDSTPINDYRVPIDRLDVIERASGVIFFDQLVRDKVDKPLALPDNFRDDKRHKKRLAN